MTPERIAKAIERYVKGMGSSQEIALAYQLLAKQSQLTSNLPSDKT